MPHLGKSFGSHLSLGSKAMLYYSYISGLVDLCFGMGIVAYDKETKVVKYSNQLFLLGANML